MTWTSDDVNAYEGHDCVHCSEFEKAHWIPDVAETLALRKLCHTCNFWREQHEADSMPENNGKAIITDSYEHYRIGDRHIVNKSFAGFGGDEFVVFWHNKSKYTTVTRNLWHQGKIPEHLREAFVPNATLLTSYEILKKAHFVELLNL